MNILYLTLKARWFDMILAGEKRTEYREIKPYWESRLSVWDGGDFLYHKSFDLVLFKNGYNANARTMIVDEPRIYQGVGREDWGAIPDRKYYCIDLGTPVLLPNWSEAQKLVISKFLNAA